MQQAITLERNGMTLRGMMHLPDGHGEGQRFPAVILFHGFTGNKLEPHRLFVKISRALAAQGLACFRFDFLGSGESDGDFEDMTVAGEVEDANAILDMVKTHPNVDASRVVLLGLSMGGLVASLVAGERSDEIHRLVLLAPAATMYRRADEYDRAVAAGEVPDGLDIAGKDVAFDNGGNLVGRAFLDGLRGMDAYATAKGYDGPVLLVHGTRDDAVPVQASYDYQEKCYGNKAQLCILDGADHTFNKYEWEQTVISEITRFLASV